MRLFALASLLLLPVAVAGCTLHLFASSGESAARQQAEEELTIFAAASLTDAVQELAAAFAAQHGEIDIVTSFAGSSSLSAQLLEGAPADLFASANPTQMEELARAGLLVGETHSFAANQIVVIVPASNPAAIARLADLAEPGVALVSALPGVPIRTYTDEALASLAGDLRFGPAWVAAVRANIVSEELNVRQVAAKVALGEADAGFVYRSDVTPEIAARVQQIELPAEHQPHVTYAIGQLHAARSPMAASTFIDFVLSDEGQLILQRWRLGSTPE